MKKRNFQATLWGFLLFFLTNTLAVSATLLVYSRLADADVGHGGIAAVMLLVIFFLSLLFTLVDFIRRTSTVERSAEKILEATKRIASGDFSVRLQAEHAYEKYDQYDEIMENLNIMAAELEKTEILKSDFISNVSHEMKTPLSIIHNYAQLLARENLDAESREKYTQTLLTATKRLTNLVRDILRLNKLENERILPEKEVFCLSENLAEIVLSYENLLEDKNLILDVDMDEFDVFTIKSYLEMVCGNLLSNAIKFTNAGGRVALKCKKEDKNVVISVTDTGVGISKETGKHIFDKFYQGDTSHAQEGNGLGLALVKRVIEVLGGEISVESEPNKGTCFTVLLKDAVMNI